MPESRIAPPSRILEAVAWVAVAAVVGGTVLGGLRLVPALVAFRLFGLGGLMGLVVALIALVRRIRGRRLGTGTAVASVIGVVFVALAARAARSPVINDYTTDLADPPGFRHAASLPANAGRDLGYPAAFAEQQRACCADLEAIRVAKPPADAASLVVEVARAMPGWTVTASDPAGGIVEAVAVSSVFGFQDDVVVRVRPDGAGSRVDVRSKSRDGRGDLGANADRIREFRSALRARAGGA